MPLTRQLYREDEVRAALIWCILKRRVQEAAFWATELVESGVDFLDELWVAWTYGIGVAGLGFIPHMRSEVAVAVSLSRWPHRDSSVVAILGSKPCRVGAPKIPAGNWTPEQTYALRAMMQGKAGSAFAARPFWDTALWTTAMRFKHGRLIDPTPLQPVAVQTAIICQRRLNLVEPVFVLEPDIAAAIEEWDGETNLRLRRAHTIPIGCLSMLTRRGKLDPYTSTESELTDTRRLEKALAASPLWAEAVEAARASDEGREEFYDSYFCDIPDEWSAADRAKSHGRGLNACDIRAFIHRWFHGMPCAAIWNGIANADLSGNGFVLEVKTYPLILPPVKRVFDNVLCQG